MSQPAAINPYLRTKVMTATPEELRLLLYDGGLKFCRQAHAALNQQRFEDSYHNLLRAQKVVLELSTSLKHTVDEELCGRLSALYTYIYRKLVDAGVSREPAGLDEAIRLLEYERETWKMLMHQNGAEGGTPHAGPDTAAPSAPPPAPPPRRAIPSFGNPYAAPGTTYSRSA